MLPNFLLYTLNLGDLVKFYGFYCQLLADNSAVHNLMPSTFSFPVFQGHISTYICSSSLGGNTLQTCQI